VHGVLGSVFDQTSGFVCGRLSLTVLLRRWCTRHPEPVLNCSLRWWPLTNDAVSLSAPYGCSHGLTRLQLWLNAFLQIVLLHYESGFYKIVIEFNLDFRSSLIYAVGHKSEVLIHHISQRDASSIPVMYFDNSNCYTASDLYYLMFLAAAFRISFRISSWTFI
jgi:hypothetical protein